MNKRQAKKNVRKHHRKLWKNVKKVIADRYSIALCMWEEMKHDCFLPLEYVIDEEEIDGRE